MAEEWYFTTSGQQMGPVSGARLRDMAAQGNLQPTDLVWKDGMSSWTPAGATRGLFPSQPSAADAIPEVRPAVADVRPRYDRSRDWDDAPRRSMRRPEPQGMTTGVKLLICGAIASILLIGGLFAVLVVAAAMAPVGGPMGGGAAPAPGPPPPGARFGNPQQIPQTNSYTISFTKPGEEHIKTVQLRQGQHVRVTVTTTQWGGPMPPDVDLYVLDANGRILVDDMGEVVDDGPEKDCDVDF